MASNSTASAGYGVIAAKGLIPIATGYVLGNISGSTAFPTAVPISGITYDLDIGSTTITGGTTTRILYDNAGVLGEYTISGSGTVVAMANSPSLTTPDLGTPSAAVLTNATGLPVSTGISGLGTGVATFLATPSSGNLASAVTGETGSGALVFGTDPSFTNSIALRRTAGTYGVDLSTNNATGNSTVATTGAGSTLTISPNTSLIIDKATNLQAALTYGGVTLANSVTGTGSMVLSAGPTFTGTLSAATISASATIQTAAPAGASAGLWKLGSLVVGAVTPDATQSVFVDIGGVVYKFIIAA